GSREVSEERRRAGPAAGPVQLGRLHREGTERELRRGREMVPSRGKAGPRRGLRDDGRLLPGGQRREEEPRRGGKVVPRGAEPGRRESPGRPRARPRRKEVRAEEVAPLPQIRCLNFLPLPLPVFPT